MASEELKELKQQLRNTKTLRNYLIRKVKDREYDHSAFWRPSSNCGCALGHATQSGKFGLKDLFLPEHPDYPGRRITAVADALFGEGAYERVFSCLKIQDRTRKEVIEALTRHRDILQAGIKEMQE